MATNEGRKSKPRNRPKVSAQSRGDESQLQPQAGLRGAGGLHTSVASPGPAARAAETAAAPRGETELPFKGWPAPAETAPARRGRLLDAWHATFSSPLTIGLLKSRPPVVEAAMEYVSVPDDRMPVSNTTDFPYRCIAMLISYAPDGTVWGGTGWFASPRVVVTAGHVVYFPKNGGWASQVEVYPGRNGGSSPYGSCVSNTFRSTRGWTEQQQMAADYGAVLLPDTTLVGNFGYASLTDGELGNVLVNVYGYPGDKPDGTLWGNYRQLVGVTEEEIYYNISTYEGESGAPVFIKEGDHRTVVGIHNYGGPSSNWASRITDQVFDNIDGWKAEVP